MNLPPRTLKAGEPITERWLAELVETVGRRLSLTAAPPLVAREDQTGVHLALAWEPRLEPFVLRSELEPGGDAEAELLLWTGTVWTSDSSGPITVYDAILTFQGEPGTRGWATFHHQSGRWQVVQLACEPAESSSSSALA